MSGNYGTTFNATDVRTLAENMSIAEAEEWMEQNALTIIDYLVDAGWEKVGELLEADGHKLNWENVMGPEE